MANVSKEGTAATRLSTGLIAKNLAELITAMLDNADSPFSLSKLQLCIYTCTRDGDVRKPSLLTNQPQATQHLVIKIAGAPTCPLLSRHPHLCASSDTTVIGILAPDQLRNSCRRYGRREDASGCRRRRGAEGQKFLLSFWAPHCIPEHGCWFNFEVPIGNAITLYVLSCLFFLFLIVVVVAATAVVGQ
jgi:hypothetical protein